MKSTTGEQERKGQVLLKCPACYNKLTSMQVGSITLDICQEGCGGIWFDPFELERIEEQDGAAEQLLHIQRDELLYVDPKRKRECPRCRDVKLHRHFFSAKRKIQVDQCPNCGGYWLDAGELAAIRNERSQQQMAGDAKQYSISSEVIRYLYRLQTEDKED
jgi:uncharacterized protein